MDLEELIWPFKTVDNTLKFAHDAVTAGAEKIGLDRFSLAKYAVIGGTTAFGALTAVITLRGDYYGAAALGIFDVAASITLLHAASKLRDYFSTPKDTLNELMEFSLTTMRNVRMIPLGFAIAFAAIANPYDILGEIITVSFTGGLTAISSSMYFMDGDHSNWDKAKAKAKVKSAYHSLSNLIPKKLPTQQPTLGAAIDYSRAA